MNSQASVSELLEGVSGGDARARDQLMAMVYNELRRLADSYLQRERPGHTLQPTALVHEAYLRLVGQGTVRWQSREHFVAIAATMMRRVLIDYARTRKRDKRGGDYKMPLAEAERLIKKEEVDLVALDDALKKLAAAYPVKAQVVELRFFGGLTIEETARVLKISDSTVERDWKFARAWLLREMGGE